MKRRVFLIVMVCLFPALLNAHERELSLHDCIIITGFYSLWEKSFFGMGQTREERGAWIRMAADPGYEFIFWEITPERDRVSWRGKPIPDNVVGQAHTHPDKDDPRPSKSDREIAKRMNLPIYTISRDGIWKVDPQGMIVKVAGKGWFKARDVCAR